MAEASADSGLAVLGGGMRRMVDLVNRLRASGIEDLGLPLPRIAVVGNQSAGKSSLIEAISGIKVPRYTGTCTRCPLEINLSEASHPRDSWHCHISLRFKKRYDPDTVSKNTSTGRSSSPWVEQKAEQVAFLDIVDKSQVERALVAAQQAVLNPSRNWREYAREMGKGVKDGEDGFEVKFSPNVVCMDITAPDLPNLAFIDLPGLIQTTESESENYLIDLVTGLAKEYINQPDCLILLALTMKDDAVNQSAARIAHEYGEERTIGALTKPDTVGPGEYDQWVNILRGNSHRLKHGYFVTKQPNQEQLNQKIDHAQARAQEAEFFAKSEPWATDLQDLQHRFGTQALQSYLAKELGELIKKRLPDVIKLIKEQHAEVKEKLVALPPPPTDNQLFLVYNLIHGFNASLNKHLLGDKDNNEFPHALRQNTDQFIRSLGSVRPTLKVFETFKEENDVVRMLETPRKEKDRSHNNAHLQQQHEGSPSLRKGKKYQQGPEVHTLSSGDEGTVAHVKKRKVTNEATVPITPKKLKRVDERKFENSLGVFLVIGPLPPESPLIVFFFDIIEHKYNLPQIRHIIDSTATAQIPGQVDPKAIENLIKETIYLWRPILEKFIADSAQLLNRRVHNCFVENFETYKKSPIFVEVYTILQNQLKESYERLNEAGARLWNLEVNQICTLNDEDYKKHISNHSRILKERRKRNLLEQNEHREQQLQAENNGGSSRKRKLGGGGMNGAGGMAMGSDDNPMDDPYSKEIDVLAEVRAYSEVAQKRFIDNVYMTVRFEIATVFLKAVPVALDRDLGLQRPDSSQVCAALLVEDPQKEKERGILLQRSEQLSRAMEELCRITD
ncbi:P-loop containing nucleoside triphosphate hydrolase protein [Morchella conica CCBAS932]|uniref:P-loop containing nucleoside triphosphate hydrolase protein n=1 Tax=Morchella conica CCBAS932 TaxID=1392247 RepID=A0A3N4KVN6_9PEZI|nr:P-loop containing nucleoside triphosphate hydrolase protein [Morchella conica CCBAS932]